MTDWEEKPYPVDVKKGEKKSLCTCHKSQTPPFCDGSHKGEGFVPMRVSFDEDKTVEFCGCGLSENLPCCNHKHNC